MEQANDREVLTGREVSRISIGTVWSKFLDSSYWARIELSNGTTAFEPVRGLQDSDETGQIVASNDPRVIISRRIPETQE